MSEKLTRDQQRAEAREKAKLSREKEVKKNKRRKLFIQLGILAGALSVGAIVFFTVSSAKPPTPQEYPVNLISDGVVMTQDLDVVQTESSNGTPVTTVTDEGKVKVDIFVDYLCPFCKQFEGSQEKVLKKYVQSGDVQLEIHPLSMVSQYSAIAANASACVAETDSKKWWDFNYTLYADQPDEAQARTWSKKKSIDYVKTSASSLGVNEKTMKCIEDVPYFDWSVAATERAATGPLPYIDVKAIQGTPTVIIDGMQWRGDFVTNPNALDEFLASAVAAKK